MNQKEAKITIEGPVGVGKGTLREIILTALLPTEFVAVSNPGHTENGDTEVITVTRVRAK